ncbi:hypothetical protein Dimus_034623 [Dionaea muscipula]
MDYDHQPSEMKDLLLINPWKPPTMLSETEMLALDEWRRRSLPSDDYKLPLDAFDCFLVRRCQNSPSAPRTCREPTTVVVRDQYTAAIDNESEGSESDDDGDGDQERNNKQHMKLPSDNTLFLAMIESQSCWRIEGSKEERMDYDHQPSELKELLLINPWKPPTMLSETEMLALDEWRRRSLPSETDYKLPLDAFDCFLVRRRQNSPSAPRTCREPTTVVVLDDHRDQYTAAMANESEGSESDDEGDGDDDAADADDR